MPVAQVPALTDENADPMLVRNRQEPLIGLRTVMSALPSPLKSPTEGNWKIGRFAQTVGVAVPDAGVSVTHQSPVAEAAAKSPRPSPLKSPATCATHVLPAGRVASGSAVKPPLGNRLMTNSSPDIPMMALAGGGRGGATVTENVSSTNFVASKTEVARTVTTPVPTAPGPYFSLRLPSGRITGATSVGEDDVAV